MQLRMNTLNEEETKLGLRKTSHSLGSSRGDEQVILSDGEVAIATSRAEKLLDRSSGESEDAGILRESSTKAWAFAAYKKHVGRRSFRRINQSIITACSKEAKAMGIQAGMRYEDARAILPELRVLVYGQGGRHGKQRA